MVVNLSNRALTETNYKALNHGLQFDILPLKFNFIDVQTEFENLYRQVRPHQQNTKRILSKTKLIKLYSKYKSIYFYDKLCGNNGLSPLEMEALLSILEDKSLIICKPDKGNRVVLMNKTDYVQKNECNFTLVKSDQNVRNLEKFQNCFNRLKKGEHLDEDIYERIRPFAAVTPTLYGLPKTRKGACPYRPVLASNDCFNCKCASWLNEILNPLRQHQTNIKDTFDFIKRIQESSSKQNSIMIVSFDVKSFFTNIPVDFVIDLIRNKIYDSNLSKTFHGLTKRQLRTLLAWTTKRTTFNFNGNSYDQIDGLAMGSPIAPAFADIFMNWIIEKTTEFSIQSLMFYRCVDDCFAVFPNRVSA